MSAGFDSSSSRRSTSIGNFGGTARAFQAGSMAGHGSVLWLLDVSHPVLVRRAGDGSITTHVVPGPVRGSGIVGWKIRWLHADDSGCWIVGPDGIAHCDHAGTVRVLDENPVSVSALAGGTLATVSRARKLGTCVVELRTTTGPTAVVPMPADVESLGPAPDGFLVFMRTEAHGRLFAQTDRGPWCGRIGIDGSRTLGTAWPRAYWGVGDVNLVDLGTPIAVRRSGCSQVLGEQLLPVGTVPIESDFGPWPVPNGPWFALRSSTAARRWHDTAFDGGDSRASNRFTYFRLDPHRLRPKSWAVAPGFPKDLALLPDLGQLWVSTTDGLFATDLGAVDRGGALTLNEVDAAALSRLDLPVPPPEMGDPDRWAMRERERLISENVDQGVLDVEIDGWFPTASIIVTFRLPELPRAVCARRYPLFTRDGMSALWRGAPTLMQSIRMGIDESGGVERVRSTAPGPFGWIWV